MDVHYHSLIPLVAAIAYIPLFAILISNRPWQKWHRLFALYLAAAMLWSTISFFLRSDFFIEYKLLLFRATMCSYVWLAVQFYYFVRFYFARSGGLGTWLGYAALAMLIVLSALGYAPQSVTFDAGEVFPALGWWLFVAGVPPLLLTGSIIWFLLRRRMVSVDPQESNRITYLLIGIIVVLVSTFAALTPLVRQIPIPHLGSLINACILIYAVLRYRLLTVNFVMRRALVYGFMATMFLLVYSLWLFVINIVFGFGFTFVSYLVVGLLTAASAAAFWARARVYIYRKVDQIFYGESYNYRQELVEFIVRKAPAISNLGEFGRELMVPLTKAVGCWQAHLLLPDAGNGDFVAQFAEPQEKGNPPLKMRQDSPVIDWLKRENRYLSKETLDITPEFHALWGEEKDGFRAADVALLFPMVSRGNLVSILALGKKQSGKYTLEDVNLVETITSQVATSLEKEYLQEQLRKREQELALINRLDTVISSSLNIREAYGAFIVELKKVIDVDWATIALIEGDELRFEVLSTELGSAWQVGERIPLKGTGTELVAKRKKAFFEPDLAKTRRFWTGEAQLKQGLQSIVYLPLIVKGEAIGSLIVASRQPNAYTPTQVHLLENLATQIAMPVENSRLYAKAEQRARVDELTGLFNRRHFDERLGEEIDRHSRYGGMLSLIFLDLDFFKDYNDKRGHPAGDKMLTRIGRLIEKSIRNIDIAFRYGGDEFAVLLPHSEADEAFVVAERVRTNIATEMRKKRLSITSSLGLASWPSDGVTTDELVTAADRALYYTKQTGGNRTCVASKMLPSLTRTAGMSTITERGASSTIYALAATIEARDPFTYGHSKKVSSYAVALAEAIGLPSEKVTVVSTAALLHDIGKIGIPDDVLNKVGKLEAETWEFIQSHAKLSATIVGHVVSLVSCLPAILHHHERWDGTGYPSGLKGEAIPIEARVLSIADAFDAMTSPRPYRETMSYKKVLDELKRGSGTQFDPKIVEAFLPIALSTAPEEIGEMEDSEISNSGS